MPKPTPQSFAAEVLRRLGIHQTPGAIQALVGWERAEGGNWHNQATYNPLNTTQPAPGAGNTGSQGNIKAYRSWDQGVQATVDTLKNGRYGEIIRALAAGNPQSVAHAIGQSPWGTSAGLVQQTIAGTPLVKGAQPFGSGGSSGSPAAPTSTTKTTPGVDRSGERRALILNWLQTQHRPGALVQLASGLQGAQDTPAKTVTVTRHAGSTPSSQHAGTATFDGKPVAAWIKPLLDYARQKGWRGTVTSGVRTDAEQTAIYKSGVRPAAVPKSMGGAGSNHERTGFLQGAVDVTDPQTLDRILKAKHSRLQYAGAKDPVHFSVPNPNGSY